MDGAMWCSLKQGERIFNKRTGEVYLVADFMLDSSGSNADAAPMLVLIRTVIAADYDDWERF